MSAVGVLMAGGAAIGTAGTASAATPTQVTQITTNRGCYYNNWFGSNCFSGANFYGTNYGYGYGSGFGYTTPFVVVVLR
jgi:hypothetical protein